MLSEPVRVSICVATFKRPQPLVRLLNSLDALSVPAGADVQVIVTDNDRACSARETVADFAMRARFSVTYAMEPVQNISRARNRCVELTSGDFIAFVDDDEEVSPHWLAHLMLTAERFNADVVFGPVIYRLPPDTPDWVRGGNFYTARRCATGTPVQQGATGNALVRSSLMKGRTGPFDPAFGLTGGEDHDLFTRLGEEGAAFFWCDEAEVSEYVGDQRLTIRYLLGKALRGGQQFAAIRLLRLGPGRRAAWFFYRLLLVAVALIMTTGTLFLGRSRWVRWLQKACSNAGQLSVLTRFRYEQYAERTHVFR